MKFLLFLIALLVCAYLLINTALLPVGGFANLLNSLTTIFP